MGRHRARENHVPTTTNGDVELHYETFGDQAHPALVLVNGLGSQSIRYRDEWCQLFVDAGFFTIRFDNRDTGLSTKFDSFVPDPRAIRSALAAGERPDVPYDLGDMALDVVSVLDAVGVDRAHVMGLSMGGMITQMLAIEHPHRLHTITSVMSTTGEAEVGRSSPEAMQLFTKPARPDRDGVIERQIEAARTYGSPDHVDPEFIAEWAGEEFDRCFHPTSSARHMAAVQASGSRAEGLRSVTIPTLVVHGDQDRLLDPSGGRRTAELVPGARFVLIEGMGHDYPPAFWQPIVELVASHAGLR